MHGDAAGGATGLLAVVAALVERERTGRGDYVDVSQTEALIPQLAPALAEFVLNGRVAQPMGNRDAVSVQGVYRCLGEDSWLAVTIDTDDEWSALCRALDRPDLIADPRFADQSARRAHHNEFDEVLEQWCGGVDHYEAFHWLQASGVTAGPVLTINEAFADPHHRARGFFEPLTYPYTGTTLNGNDTPGTHDYAGPIFDMSLTPIAAQGPAPSLGEHNEYVFKTILGLSDEAYDKLISAKLIGTNYQANSDADD